jgi:hypothetical protein
MRYLLPSLLLVFCSITPAAYGQTGEQEEFLTGHELLQSCRGDESNPPPTQFCMEFVYQFVTTVVSLEETMQEQKMFCIDPNAISLQEVTLKVTDWLEDNTGLLDEPAFLLVSEALHVSYPCGTPKMESL